MAERLSAVEGVLDDNLNLSKYDIIVEEDAGIYTYTLRKPALISRLRYHRASVVYTRWLNFQQPQVVLLDQRTTLQWRRTFFCFVFLFFLILSLALVIWPARNV